MTKEIEKIPTVELTIATPTPADLLQVAVQQGADLDKMEKLMELQERWEANQAKKQYVLAMTKFKANPPEILKKAKVSYGQTHYDYASLDHVTDEINKALSTHGLFASWSQNQAENLITVTCKITHEEGHSETTSLTAAPDVSGAKNAIQSLGSTITYLQRYTILALTGLAAKGMDTNGNLPENETKINDQQLLDIQTLQADAKLSDAQFTVRLKKKYNVDKLESLTESQAISLIKSLEAIRA